MWDANVDSIAVHVDHRPAPALVTQRSTYASLDVRDNGGDDAVVKVVVIARGQSPTLRVQAAIGWRLKKVQPRFSVADAGDADAAGVHTGTVGAEVLLRSQVEAAYGSAVGVARIPCGSPAEASPHAVASATLSNGRRRASLDCRFGGTGALVGDGTSLWSLDGPVAGPRNDGSARIVVIAL